MILIVSLMADVHTRQVLRRIEEKGGDALLFNCRHFSDQWEVSTYLSSGQPARAVARHRRRNVDLSSIQSVWLRRTRPVRFKSSLSADDEKFARKETDSFLGSLALTLSGRGQFWVNAPASQRATDAGLGKVSQLELARSLGLRVPRSLFTNDPEEARAFVASCKDGAIYKPFEGLGRSLKSDDGSKPKPAMLYTTMLDEKALQRFDDVRLAPCIFQEYVPKKVELRVVVIGNKVFATEICSQEREKTKTDWRHYGKDLVTHRAHELPGRVIQALLALHRALGLVYGAADLIVTPDGEYVFLEVNPAGQFLFLEALTGQPMLESFCEMLLHGGPDYRCDAPMHAPGLPDLPPADPEEYAEEYVEE